MKRRDFIRHGTLWVPTLFSIGRARGQAFTFRDPATVRTSDAPTATCPADGSPSVVQTSSAGFDKVGNITDQYYVGQYWPNDQPERKICKVTFSYEKSGSPASKVWICQIFTLTGNDLNTVVANGASNTVTGLNAGTQTDVQFTFATPPTLAASTAHAIVMSLDAGAAVDASNSVYLYRTASSGGTILGYFSMWASNKTLFTNRPTEDTSIKIYYYA